MLETFLNENRATTKRITHTSLNPPRKYYIPPEKKKVFYNNYKRSYIEGTKLSIVELQTTNYIPIIVDIDLKKECLENTKNHPKLYSEENIRDLCEAFMNVLMNVLDPTPIDLKDLTIYIFERDGYFLEKNGKRFFKNGFHLHAPKIMLTRQDIKTIVIPKVIRYMIDNQLSKPSICNNINELIDDCIYDKSGKPWFLYGSTKECANPYLISKCYEIQNEDIVLNNNWIKSLYDYKLVYNNGVEYNNTNIDETNDERQKKDTELLKTLPEIFSLQTEGREEYYYNIDGAVEIEPTTNIFQLDETVSEFEGDSVIGREAYQSQESEEKTEVFCDALLDLLPPEYYNDYDKWINIGFILYNIFDGTGKGWEKWDKFSQKSEDKYDYTYALKLWNKMEKKKLTLGSLRYIVKMSCPLEYKDLVNKISSQYMSEMRINISMSGLHYDLAKMLFIEYEDVCKCASIKHNTFYVYKDHHWKQDDEGIFLRSKISTLLVSKYNRKLKELQKEEKLEKINEIKENEQHLIFYRNQLKTYEDYLPICPSSEKAKKEKEIETFRKKINEKEDAIQKIREDMEKNNCSQNKNARSKEIDTIIRIIANLKTSPFKKNIMNEAKEIFYDSEFANNLDKNPWLFCFKNGVYDLKEHIFRSGVPDDMLSLKSRVNYNPDLTMDSQEIKDVELFFLKLFPNKNIRDYFLFLMSEIFEGRNGHKVFLFFTGSGDNGKTIFCDMLEKMLGDLCIKLPTSIISGKRTASSAATPELERAGSGRRVAIVQEPQSSDCLNSGIIKELSGNDTYFSRGLFQNGREITPMFTPILACNEIPRLEGSENDEAIWKRIIIIPFQSKFLLDPALVPTTFEEQVEKKIFPCDVHMSDKLHGLTEGIARYLLHVYKNRKSNVMNPPEEVLVSADHFRKSNDLMNQYISDRILFKAGEHLIFHELFAAAKDHIRENNPGKKLPSQSVFREYINKKFGHPINGTEYHGVCFKNSVN